MILLILDQRGAYDRP